MATKTATKEVSKGICSFCNGEFEKAKMTQHLKYCKQSAAEIATKIEGTPVPQKTRLFHILVEGRYNPQYWMHVEMPASAALADLDDFLRAIWLECCGHLCDFTIGGTSYSSESEDYFSTQEEEIEEEVEEVEEELNVDEACNIEPVMACKVCGKPAKFVVGGYFDVEENAFWSKKCVKKSGEDAEMLLPVVNSPRVGVCAYTGED